MAQTDIVLNLSQISKADLTNLRNSTPENLEIQATSHRQTYKSDLDKLKVWKAQIDAMSDSAGKTTRLAKYNERLTQFRRATASYKTAIRVWM
jgi:hypothetical protein